MSRKKVKFSNRIILFAIVAFALSCSGTSTKNISKKEKIYVSTKKKIIPNFTIRSIREDEFPCLITEVKHISLHFGCTLRNDSPYYWCSLETMFTKPTQKLPSKSVHVFPSVVNDEIKIQFEKFMERLKNAKKPVFIVGFDEFFVDDENHQLINKMHGAFNEQECMDFDNDFTQCPKTAKRLNIYTGKKYIP